MELGLVYKRVCSLDSLNNEVYVVSMNGYYVNGVDLRYSNRVEEEIILDFFYLFVGMWIIFGSVCCESCVGYRFYSLSCFKF